MIYHLISYPYLLSEFIRLIADIISKLSIQDQNYDKDDDSDYHPCVSVDESESDDNRQKKRKVDSKRSKVLPFCYELKLGSITLYMQSFIYGFGCVHVRCRYIYPIHNTFFTYHALLYVWVSVWYFKVYEELPAPNFSKVLGLFSVQFLRLQ